jgi:hypothetical protein
MKEFFIDLQTNYKERFTLGKFMEFVGDNYDPLTSHVLNAISDLKAKGSLTIQGQDKRPDNLSYMIYGDNQYWWVLMVYNGWLSVDDIKNGGKVSYPDIGDLEDLYFSLKVQQDN